MPVRLDINALVPLHYQDLYRYAYRLAGNSNDAEDLVQETFCSAQSNQEQLRDATRVKSWLFSILYHAFLLHQRRKKKLKYVTWEQDLDHVPMAEPELPAVNSTQLQAGLMEVPEDYRAVLILYYFEDFSYRDIATQLGIPIGTVMSRLARAKQFLKHLLSKHVEQEE